MSYRPPSPDYRSRRYSPSRGASISPPPARRPPPYIARPDERLIPRDTYNPRYEYSPPRRRYSPSPPRHYAPRERSPPRRALPPPGRFDRSPPRRPRSRSPEWDMRDGPSTVPVRSYDRSSHDERGRQPQRVPPQRGMAADWEELRPPAVARPPSVAVPPEKWQRVRDANEFRPPQASGRKAPQPQSDGAESSRDVVFIGIDDELSENDLIGYLRTEHRALIDNVKIVRKPSTDPGRSKNLAFVTFASLAGAEDFVDNNSTGIIMPALYARSDPKKIRIDFARPAPIISHIPKQSARIPHDGMRDVGPSGGGNRVLVLRQLDAATRGEAVVKRISEEITRMLAQVGQERLAEQAIHRAVTIIDRAENLSWGICFVELASSELAVALLSHLISPQAQPSGFRISGIPVAASFASTSSFLPATSGEFLISSSQSGGIGSNVQQQDGRYSYWHPQGGAVESIPHNNPPVGPLSPELRDFLGQLAGSLRPATVGPVNPGLLDRTGLLPIKLGKKKKEETMMTETRNILEEEVVEDKDSQLLSRTKGTNIVLPQSGRKIANNINKWNNKQTELAKPVAPAKAMSEANHVPVAVIEDYTDTTMLSTTGKVACLLCTRQFNTEEMLRKHVAQSGLHKTNLLNPEIVSAGKQRKAAAMTEYRDRAAERRKAFNQPDKPGWTELKPEKKRKYADGPAAPVLPEPTIEPGRDESNVGNQLLAKMGWKTGTGLGAEGAGRLEPIKVQQFAERAGLGASQGHAAGSWTGSGGRAQQAHDVSQARYRASGP